MLAWCWCLWEVTPFCIGWLLEKLFFPIAVAGVVYWFAVRQLRKKRGIDFAEKKLTEFYAPMVAARTDILASTKFDRTIRNSSQLVDIRKQREERRRPEDYMTREYTEKAEKYRRELEVFFDGLNKRFMTDNIDAYLAMRKLFVTKYAYADQDTQHWYDYFYAFGEMWKTIRANETEQFMTGEVKQVLGGMFDEELLQPFYTHLVERARFYQLEIAGETVEKVEAPQPPSSEPMDLVRRLKEHPVLAPFLRIRDDEG